MQPLKLAVLDDFQDVARTLAPWATLSPRAEITFFNDNVTGEALAERLQPFDGVMLIRERTKLPRALVARLPRLKLVISAGMRNLGIDLDACRDHGVTICGTGSGSAATAELAWGMLLALSRHIVAEDKALREGRWQTKVGAGVAGQTLGLVGLGKLGGQMAAYGKVFGMKVLAWSPNLTPERATPHGALCVTKEELFQLSDYISLHVVLSDRTRGLVGAADIARMKPSACLINTSRAALVDEPALIEALKAGRIAGAAVDVYDVEPLPKTAAILSAPNTILTPHLGYATRETYEVYFREAVENIAAYLDGKPIRLMT